MRRLWAKMIRQSFVLALLVLGLVVIGLFDFRHFRDLPARARVSEARAKAIEIAARSYEKMYGHPAPPYRNPVPGEVFYIQTRREEDRRDYLIGFGNQMVVNEVRDFLGRPIPFKSGSTTFVFFRVKDDGTCEYAWIEEAGEY